MKVTVNGAEQDVPPGTTVRTLVTDLHRLAVDKVAVEVNKRLVRTAQYDRLLADGDQIEIVTFVGGG